MSNYNLKAKNKKTGEIEVFTAIDNSSSYSYLSEDLYTHYSSKEFNDLYDIVEECKCREMTCPKGCKAYHTHKTFWCEHCYEDRNLPKPMTQEEYDDSKHLITKSIKPDNNWIEQFNQKFPHKIAEVIDDFGSPLKSDLQTFITTLLEKQRDEYVEMIENYPTRIDGNKDEVLSAMHTAKKLKQDIINLIKSHDKTS